MKFHKASQGIIFFSICFLFLSGTSIAAEIRYRHYITFHGWCWYDFTRIYPDNNCNNVTDYPATGDNTVCWQPCGDPTWGCKIGGDGWRCYSGCGTNNPIESIGTPCTAGIGACERTGVMVCSADGTVVCDAVPGEPSPEVCDGIDNNCNGATDDNIPPVDCSAGIGACKKDGHKVCTAGAWSDCDATPGEPSPEVCDGVDNNCNGAKDEGCASKPAGSTGNPGSGGPTGGPDPGGPNGGPDPSGPAGGSGDPDSDDTCKK